MNVRGKIKMIKCKYDVLYMYMQYISNTIKKPTRFVSQHPHHPARKLPKMDSKEKTSSKG